MAKQGFLGTIGWIKSNLMVSSQASEKGYSNENFYPGAPNIPDSEPTANFLPISFKTSNVTIDENGIVNTEGKSNYYIDLLNTPDLYTFQNWELGFKAKVLTSGSRKLVCAIAGAGGSWFDDYAFQLLNYPAANPAYGVMLYSSSDNVYRVVPRSAISDTNWHEFKIRWETGVGFTLSVDQYSATAYRANFTANTNKNIRWGYSGSTHNMGSLDTKSVYLKWWNS